MDDHYCSIEGCEPEYPEYQGVGYGWCNHCELFTICYKQDEEHNLSLLYNEACRWHHSGGYSVCRPCALEAYKKKNPEATDERCICPECEWDFGKLNDLQTKPTDQCLKRNCSIEGCVPKETVYIYGSCNNCSRFTICSDKDQAHSEALLYNEGCREHCSGGYSICKPCALKTYQERTDSTEKKYMCPSCEWIF